MQKFIENHLALSVIKYTETEKVLELSQIQHSHEDTVDLKLHCY
jgi:hypothetical protein